MVISRELSVASIIQSVQKNPHVKDKLSISQTYLTVGDHAVLPKTYLRDQNIPREIALGDDCTAIPDGKGGYTLFAAEGIISEFLEKDPWFAGYSAVMVNISDILSMGGLPTAVTDTIWGESPESLKEIWEGMKAASEAYDVPIVGGHTCYGSEQKALSVSILGSADQLLTSFDAEPGQSLLMAVDMNGAYYKSYPFWNASTSSTPENLQRKKGLLKNIADRKLSKCAKDISMGGLLGSIAMLAHTSEVGFDIVFDQIIPPADEEEDWVKWLTAFPSFGYILTCDPDDVSSIQEIFKKEQVTCAEIGTVSKESGINVLSDTKIKFC